MKFLLMAIAISSLISQVALAASPKEAVKIEVTEKGFEPSSVKVGQNQDVTLAVTRKTDATCAKEILFSDQKIKKELPLNKTVEIHLGKLKKGDVSFSCGMNMVSGVINVQ